MVEETQESTQEPTSAAPQAETWDVEQYEAALKHLESLQEQLDHLRSTIPSIVTPFARPTSSKAQTFAAVRKAAIQSTDDLKAFREVWSSEQTQDVFVKGKESFEKDADLSKARDVAAFGWREGSN